MLDEDALEVDEEQQLKQEEEERRQLIAKLQQKHAQESPETQKKALEPRCEPQNERDLLQLEREQFYLQLAL